MHNGNNRMSKKARHPFVLQPIPQPLHWEEGGVIRIGNSRISFDLIIDRYESGATAEDIVRLYDSLDLADVYAAISYYLRHRDQLKSYLQRRAAEADSVQARMESQRPRVTRDELVARKSAAETMHAPTGG